MLKICQIFTALCYFLLVKAIEFREITLCLPIVFAYGERMIAQNLS